MSHTVQYTAHGEGYVAWVNGQRVGWMRRELRNHVGRLAGRGTPGAWRCWRIYRLGAPIGHAATRREAALLGHNYISERTPA